MIERGPRSALVARACVYLFVNCTETFRPVVWYDVEPNWRWVLLEVMVGLGVGFGTVSCRTELCCTEQKGTGRCSGPHML